MTLFSDMFNEKNDLNVKKKDHYRYILVSELHNM